MKRVLLCVLIAVLCVAMHEMPIRAQATASQPAVSIRRTAGLLGPVFTADLNGDGILDLVGSAVDPSLPTRPQLIAVALGKGDGTYGPVTRTRQMGFVLDVADFNGDGKPDVLEQTLPQPDESVLVMPGNGDGTLGDGHVAKGTSEGFFGLSGDFDGDGKRDLLIVENAETAAGNEELIEIIRGNGDFTFAWQTATVIHASAGPRGGAIADVNGDGKPDIVIANYRAQSLTILTNQGSMTFAARDIPIGRAAGDVTAADVNRDGKVDLIVAASVPAADGKSWTEGYAVVLLGTGAGAFAAPVEYPTAPGALDIVVGDFTRDGILDLATANASTIVAPDCESERKTWTSLSILPGIGNGTFAEASNFSIGNQLNVDDPITDRFGVGNLVAADINRDAALDLVIGDGTVFVNQPTDPNWPPTVSTTGSTFATNAVHLKAAADDVDQDMLAYRWTSSDGLTIPPVPNPCLSVTLAPGTHTFTVTVDDGHGHQASSTTSVRVADPNAQPGTITITAPAAGEVVPGGKPYTIRWTAPAEMANEELFFSYTTDGWATSDHIWECMYTLVSAGQCTWINPGPDSTNVFVTLVTRDADVPGAGGTDRFTIQSAPGAPPWPWQHSDVGAVGVAGDASFANGVFTVTGSGTDIWGAADEFHYTYRSFNGGSGDMEMVTRVDSVQNAHAWTKAGLMFRSSLTADAVHASIFVTPGKGVAFQRRPAFGGTSLNTSVPGVTAPVWLRLVIRSGVVAAYYRNSEVDAWAKVGDVDLTGNAAYGVTYAGLAVTSHVDGTLAASTFANVAMTPWPIWSYGSVGLNVASATFDESNATLTSRGTDIWGTSDQFSFLFTTWDGNGATTALVTHVDNTHAWAKAGVMMRATLRENSPHVMVVVTPGKGISMQYRATTGGTSTQAAQVPGVAPVWVRVTRSANAFTGAWSADGSTWNALGTITVTMPPEVFTGLVLTSHNTTATASAFFRVFSVRR